MSDASVAAPAPAPDRPRRRRGLLFPLLLIAVGVLFLGAQYGYIPPISVRALLSLWPVLLILAGIEMLLARRQPVLALVLELAVIAGAVALAAAPPRALFGGAPGTTSAVVERQNDRAVSLRLEGGAGTYTLRGGATSLVEARSEGGEISVRTDRRPDATEVRVQPAGGDALFNSPPGSVDVRVASDLPASVRISGGAGDFIVDLHDVQIRDARVDTGASRLELTLPRPTGDVAVIIHAGATTLTLIVPDGVEARITTTGGILSTTALNPRFGSGTAASRNATAYETAGYTGAKDRVTVTIEAGASSITIR